MSRHRSLRCRPTPGTGVRTIIPGVAIALIALAVLAVAGCPKRAAFKGPDTAPVALDAALAALEAKRHGRAEEALNWVIFNFPGSREAADAQYWLAESYFRRGDFHQAQTEFEFYIRSFSYGRYQEEASYKLGLAWLRSAPAGTRDRAPLLKAEEILTDFLLSYPESTLRPQVEEALGEIELRKTGRDLSTARLYHRAGEYRSALVYYRYIAESLPLERWEPEDRLRFAVCHAEIGNADTARTVLESLLTGDNPDDLRRQARRLLDRL